MPNFEHGTVEFTGPRTVELRYGGRTLAQHDIPVYNPATDIALMRRNPAFRVELNPHANTLIFRFGNPTTSDLIYAWNVKEPEFSECAFNEWGEMV